MYRNGTTEIAEIEILEGNIILLRSYKGVVIDLVAAKRLVTAIEALVDTATQYSSCIFDISGIVYVDQEARAYFESGTDFKGQVVGVALISDSFLGRNIGNLFLDMNPNLSYPVRWFESSIRAEHWLRQNLKNAKNSERNQRNVA
jgi:hypothetical protein